jgi:tetratricopeptide (TPR) repeat protein
MRLSDRNLALGALIVLTLGTAPIRADLDPELNKPYQLCVVLRIAQHRLLTPVFCEQMQRELRDSLQAAFGGFARVEVVGQHPRLKEVEHKGLQQALDGWHFFDDVKLHFVFVDYVEGAYEIRCRQYDGSAGLASPVVRASQTVDRQLVARTTALLLDQDFGEVGTLQKVDGDKVEVALKAGALSEALGQRIAKDDIFALTQVVNQGNTEPRSYRVVWTLLQACGAPEGGMCRCTLLHRRDNALGPVFGLSGHRCLKLGTTNGALRLRVITDDKLGTPLNGRQVVLSEQGFAGAVVERLSTNNEGLVQSEHHFRRVAFVRIYDGATPLAQVPVEILGERTVNIPVSAYPEAEQRGQLMLERDRWSRRVHESVEVAAKLFKDLNALVEQSRATALGRAQAGLRSLRTDLTALSEEKADLRKKADALGKDTPLNLADGEQALEELQSRREELERYIAALEDILGKEKDPARRKWRELAEKGRLLESQAEFGSAIETYERVFAEGGNDPELRAHLDTLRQAWKVKDEGHRKAREFITERWAKIDKAAELRSLLSRARSAFETCRSAGDFLTLRMLLRTNLEHSARLEKEVETLRPREFEDDRQAAENILGLADELKSLNDEIRQYLGSAKSAAK